MNIIRHTFAASLALKLLCAVSSAQATTYYVMPCGDDNGGGLAPICSLPLYPQYTAKRTIQAAIDAAADGDAVVVLPGVYAETVTITKSIVLQAWGAATVIDGSGLQFSTVVVADAASPTILGFTITGGDFLAGGGARILDSTPTFIDCVFANNHASSSGAGAEIWYADPTFINCTFDSNVTDNGGGTVYARHSNPEFIGCVFRNNSVAGVGGAIYVGDHESLHASRCRFESNSAGDQGGAIYAWAEVSLDNCLFLNNSADTTGAAAVFGATANQSVLTNCTFCGNNTTQGSGGAIQQNGSGLVIVNSILWGNGPALINPPTAPVSITYSNVKGGWPGEGNISAKPGMYDPANGACWLTPGSPCIDAGDNDAVTSAMTVDFAGNPRRVDDPNSPDTGHGAPPVVDMGAYEFQPGQ